MTIQDNALYQDLQANPRRILADGRCVEIEVTGSNIYAVIQDEGPEKGRRITPSWDQLKASVRAREVLL